MGMKASHEHGMDLIFDTNVIEESPGTAHQLHVFPAPQGLPNAKFHKLVP